MATLSQKLSQKFQIQSQHARVNHLTFENSFDYDFPKSNKHQIDHTVWQGATDFQVTENFVFLGWTEGRWSTQCALLGKVGLMFYTLEEVAKDHLKVSRSTVYRLIRNGELQGVKVLGCTRVTEAELARFESMIGGVR